MKKTLSQIRATIILKMNYVDMIIKCLRSLIKKIKDLRYQNKELEKVIEQLKVQNNSFREEILNLQEKLTTYKN